MTLLRCGTFYLLNGGSLHQCPELLVDRLLLGVGRLGEAAQKHRRGSDILASPSKLRGIIPSSQDVMLDLAGTGSSAARRVVRMCLRALHRAHRHR